MDIRYIYNDVFAERVRNKNPLIQCILIRIHAFESAEERKTSYISSIA